METEHSFQPGMVVAAFLALSSPALAPLPGLLPPVAPFSSDLGQVGDPVGPLLTGELCVDHLAPFGHHLRQHLAAEMNQAAQHHRQTPFLGFIQQIEFVGA